MSSRLETVLTAALVVAAMSTAAVLVHREFLSSPDPPRPSIKKEYLRDWKRLIPAGRMIGDSTAPVTIIEFADLQCPFCREFHRSVQLLMQKHPKKVSLVFIHFPLRGHAFALPAARAVECAHKHGKFADLVDLLFEQQDSLKRMQGKGTDWTAYAVAAGIKDTSLFEQRMRDSSIPPGVEAGLTLAKQLGVTGTPTVIVNGWRYSAPPSDSALTKHVEDLIDGKDRRSLLTRIFGRS